MSDQNNYYYSQPPQQQGYDLQQGHQQWQPPADQYQGTGSHSYGGDQSYNQDYAQNYSHDHNSMLAHQGYQQDYSQASGYQDQYQRNPSPYVHLTDQYGATQYQHPPAHQQDPYSTAPNQYTAQAGDVAYNNSSYPPQGTDPGYNDGMQRSYSPNPPPAHSQYDNYGAAPAAHTQMNTGYPVDPAAAPFDPNDPNATQDRGLMGALAGGAVGGYAG
jgi:hypothetical protein